MADLVARFSVILVVAAVKFYRNTKLPVLQNNMRQNNKIK